MKLVFNHGVNDLKDKTQTSEYKFWTAMHQRCYSKKQLILHPTYQDCTVSENFKYFSYFYEWCQHQIGFGNKGFQLDKDILFKNNKLYSEHTCIFVPYQLNYFFTKRNANRGNFPIGVYFDANSGKYKAVCNDINGKQKNIGRFLSAQEAFFAYKSFKEELAKYYANLYKDNIDNRAYIALMSYVVELFD